MSSSDQPDLRLRDIYCGTCRDPFAGTWCYDVYEVVHEETANHLR